MSFYESLHHSYIQFRLVLEINVLLIVLTLYKSYCFFIFVFPSDFRTLILRILLSLLSYILMFYTMQLSPDVN